MSAPARWLAALGCSILASCGGYADFTLPPQPGSASTYLFEARPEPVLAPAAAGEWDSVDVLNPSVVRRDAAYWNFYSGFDGQTWHTGAAVSHDGVQWTRRGRVLSPDPRTWENGYIAANGSALLEGGEFLYWYQAGPRETPSLGLARSGDGLAWTKHPDPVLAPGPRGSWDERGVADPYVVREGPWFYMFYLGQDRARRQRLGVARSADGVRWRKLRANPIMELGDPGAFDEVGLGEPAVWLAGGAWWMLYTGRDRAEDRRLGFARSRDGVNWEKLPGAIAGGQPWNARVLCDPSVEVHGDAVRVWFGGGDASSPDENLRGRIGLAILRPAGGANLDK
jgi:predicted GH43/DUF377 family glycosyl hydrolase